MNAPPLAFAPLLPWAALGAIGGVALALAAFALWRGARGAVPRLAAVAGFLLVLSGPMLVRATSTPLPDIALVLLDASQSMGIGNRAALADAALASLEREAKGIPGLELRVARVPPADQGGTDLAAAAATALAAIPAGQRAGVIAITDGQVTPPAVPPGVPLSALIAAGGPETDRELRLLAAPSYGLVGQEVTLRFVVFDHGAAGAGPIPVSVTVDGAPEWQGTARAGQPVSVRIPVRHPGSAVVAAAAAPLAGEVSTENDSAAFTLTGIRRKLDVLLISGSPDQGVRTWRLLLKSDPAIELVHFTILRTPNEALDAPERQMALIPFPVEQLFERDLPRFDLIILDRFRTLSLLPEAYLARIAAAVRGGGALLAEFGPEFAGPDSLANTALAGVLPALPAAPGTVTGPFSPSVTPLGARHPVTAPFAGAALAPWYRFEATAALSGHAVLAGPGGAPLLVLAPEGKGRVAELTSDQFWLWTRADAAAGPATPLLRRVVHWLLREPALEAEALTAGLSGGALTVERRTLAAGAEPPATLRAPDGTMRTLALAQTAPGRFVGRLPAPAPGVWRVNEGGLATFAAVAAPNAEEYQDLAATAGHFPPAATLAWLGRGGAPALSGLIARRGARAVTGSVSVPLLPPAPALILLLALVLGAWLREGRR